MEDPTAVYEDALEIAIKYARGSERLLAAIVALNVPNEALRRLLDLDPSLAPEIRASVGHLTEAREALERAAVFQDGRFSAALAALKARVTPPTEGDTKS